MDSPEAVFDGTAARPNPYPARGSTSTAAAPPREAVNVGRVTSQVIKGKFAIRDS
jgi:hypothetical protein